MNADSPVTAVFVYGTLQRGQCRESCWPHPPLKVEKATTAGRLYDLGPYPALVDGDDQVGGELWHFAPEHMAATLAALDEVEGLDEGLYVRRVVTCETTAGASHRAHAYFFAQPETLHDRPLVAPADDGCCRW